MLACLLSFLLINTRCMHMVHSVKPNDLNGVNRSHYLISFTDQLLIPYVFVLDCRPVFTMTTSFRRCSYHPFYAARLTSVRLFRIAVEHQLY